MEDHELYTLLEKTSVAAMNATDLRIAIYAG